MFASMNYVPASAEALPHEGASFTPNIHAVQGFLAEGLQRTTAGLGSVIIDSQPLTVAVLAALLFGEKLTAASYAGLGLGVLGLSLLEVPVDVLTAFPQKVLGKPASQAMCL